MEKYFNIYYEFDKKEVLNCIDKAITSLNKGYICVADGNVVSLVQRDQSYRNVIQKSMLTICDSGWIPIFLRLIYGIKRNQYCGASIFYDIISQQKYKMAFIGTDRSTLEGLRDVLVKLNPFVKDMLFYELPYNSVEKFNYNEIAKIINGDGADIVWIALGAPKQDFFMNYLETYLHKGIMIGVGAAFNFYSGIGERRAPKWLINCHLEFLYRIRQNPRKQCNRCWLIIKSLPYLLYSEYKRKSSEHL